MRKYKRYFIKYAIGFAICLMLEIFVFNFDFWKTLSNDSVNWDSCNVKFEGGHFLSDSDEYKIDEEKAYVTIEGIDLDVNELYLELSSVSCVENQFTESGVAYIYLNFDDVVGEDYYSYKEKTVVFTDEFTHYIPINPIGKLENLKLCFELPSGYSFSLKNVVFNANKPFSFNFIRFLIALILIWSFQLFSLKSQIWKENVSFDGKKGILKKYSVIFAIIAIGAISWFLMSSNTTYKLVFDFEPYEYLTRALSKGQVNLDIEVSDSLRNMDNPYSGYDRTKNSVDAAWDFAYYNEKYYVYFGILPCLIFYLPLFKLTNMMPPSELVVEICIILFSIGIFLLMKKIIQKYYPKTSFGAYLLFSFSIIMGSQLPWFVNEPFEYIIPNMTAMVFTVFGLLFWIDSFNEKKLGFNYLKLFTGSLFMALVAACRPSMLLYSFLAAFILIPFFKKQIIKGFKRYVSVILVAFSYIIVAIPLMIYNYLRFESAFDFGNKYNLTAYDLINDEKSISRIFKGVYYYLLKLPKLHLYFPFIELYQPSGARNIYVGEGIYIEKFPAGLIPLNAIILAIIIGIIFRKRLINRKVTTVAFAGSLIAFITLCIDSEMGGIVFRYASDFSFVFLICASVFALELYEVLSFGQYKIKIRTIVAYVLLASCILNACTYFVDNFNFPLIQCNTELYYKMYYMFNFFM